MAVQNIGMNWEETGERILEVAKLFRKYATPPNKLGSKEAYQITNVVALDYGY
jgi:hypothetical protein